MLAQEHRLSDRESIQELQDWLKKQGAISLFAPAEVTESEGNSGGVAIIATQAFGLRELPNRGSELNHRIIAAEVECGPEASHRLVMASVYGEVGQRLTETDTKILKALQQMKEEHGAACIFGGDWNLETEKLELPVQQALGMELVVRGRVGSGCVSLPVDGWRQGPSCQSQHHP